MLVVTTGALRRARAGRAARSGRRGATWTPTTTGLLLVAAVGMGLGWG